ncbi:MAG: zinc-ribbon domain-containing protein [Deltaproteobacteria bacterium]|nr:zinc-ribbon domain-containing protein [Deltaproteobacteria bacterium]MBI3388250.1 zinc-ribbon domain-containing protein [Deltaproteobacteria bacterium]
MDLLLAVLLTTAVAVFVAWPFFGRARSASDDDVQLSPLDRQKREAYAAIKEAEFDHQMGKLTDADFAALRERYMLQALTAITSIEKARAKSPTAIGKGAPGHKPTRFAYCPGCGRHIPNRANFCPGCGYALKPLKEAVA